MISVVIPLYNKATTIVRCLISVFSQTVLPDELIIINDGSIDGGLEIAKQFLPNDSNVLVRLLEHENKGVAYTRNKGVLIAKNNYVAFLDADDEWDSRFLENAVKAITKYPYCSLFTCKHKIIDSDLGSYVPKQYFGNNNFGTVQNYLRLAKDFPIVNSSKVVVSKRYFISVGGFPEIAKVSEDLFLWIKLSECAPMVYINELLVTIHQAPDTSRDMRVGEVPYPIVYYSMDNVDFSSNDDLYSLLWSIHIKHVLGSCAKNKLEALKRIRYGTRLFKLKGHVLFFLLLIPRFIFNYIRVKRRTKLVKSSA